MPNGIRPSRGWRGRPRVRGGPGRGRRDYPGPRKRRVWLVSRGEHRRADTDPAEHGRHPRGDALPPRPTAGPGQMPLESMPPRAFDPARLLDEEGVRPPEDVVRVLLDLYLPGGVPPETQAKLVAFVAQGNPAGPALARRVREAVHAILAMAEYHLA